MEENEFRREEMYQLTMAVLRAMLSEGLLTREEYDRNDTRFEEKYRPVFGGLCANPDWQ